jgi:hypothetical protein
MNSLEILTTDNICKAISASVVSSASAFVWNVITLLWPWYWLWISILLVAWVAWEIATRHGTSHYNSENGFSPTFNRFVGSGTYLGLQGLLFFFFKVFLGEIVYCMIWPYAVHLIVFLSTGRLLHLSGFWPRLEQAGRRRRWRKYKKQW